MSILNIPGLTETDILQTAKHRQIIASTTNSPRQAVKETIKPIFGDTSIESKIALDIN
jgi:hypothetical protein